MIVSNPMIFSLANSTEYLASTVDGTMSLKWLNSVGSLEVSEERESHDLHDSNSLKLTKGYEEASWKLHLARNDENTLKSDTLIG
ncbi:hypothetical protein Tco_1284367 [Tanacetum coccineum]